MNIEVDFCKSKKEWDDFLINEEGSFLQSTIWGDFKSDYQKIWRIEVRKDERIVGICQVFEEKFLFWKYLYVPYGPVSKEEKIRELLIEKAIKTINGNFVFLFAEPKEKISIGKRAILRIQPQKTILLGVNKSDNEILSEFSSSTRYNTKLAIKKNVSIETSGDINSFFCLLQKTKERQQFNTYKKDYFVDFLKKIPSELHLAKHEENVVAGNIVVYFGKYAYCVHSANDYEKRKIKGANLLRYESFKMAREKGCIFFDEWGIDEKRFPGVTAFKKGFGGNIFIYPEGRYIVIKKIQYIFYSFFAIMKKIIK